MSDEKTAVKKMNDHNLPKKTASRKQRPKSEPAPRKNPRIKEIELADALDIHGDTYKTITLRSPVAGELRGVLMNDILQMNASAIIKLVPRISTPIMTEADVAGLGAIDFFKFATTVLGFFMDEKEKQKLMAQK